MDKDIKRAIKKAIDGGFKLQEIHLEETAWGAAIVRNGFGYER